MIRFVHILIGICGFFLSGYASSAALEFKQVRHFTNVSPDQAAATITDFGNKCAEGCDFYHKGLVKSEILEALDHHLIIWQMSNDTQETTHFREVSIERNDVNVIIKVKFPDEKSIAAYEKKYQKKHSTKLSQLDETWIITPTSDGVNIELSATLDTSLLSLAFVKRLVSESYTRALNESFFQIATLQNEPELLNHTAWKVADKTKDPFFDGGIHEFCNDNSWVLEGEAVELNTGVCNYITLTQDSPYYFPAGSTLRLILWHDTLIATKPVTGKIGLAIQDKVYWQEEVAIPGEAQSYEVMIKLEKALEPGDPIFIHIDNHGTNTWKILNLNWIREIRSRIAAPTYYGEVKAILESHCSGCHVKGGSTPFTLDSYEKAKSWAFAIKEAVTRKVMPPWGLDPVEGYSYKYDPSLSQEKIDTLAAWVDGGRLLGESSDFQPALPPEKISLQHTDETIAMKDPYQVKIEDDSKDDYHCTPIGDATTESYYVTGYRIAASNPAISHHATLYMVDPEFASIVDEMDQTDPDVGYSCYGDPIAEGFEGLPISIVGLAMNEAASVFPAGSGILVKKGARFVLQMHYSLAGVGADFENLANKTEVHFQTAETVEKVGTYLTFFDTKWLLPGGMRIPAGTKAVTHSYEAYPPQSEGALYNIAGLDFSEGMVIHSVGPHMHKFGVRAALQIVRENGLNEPFVNLARWNANFQREYHLQDPVFLSPREKINLSCTYDNSPENQPAINGEIRPPQDIFWGNDSLDEMCASALFVTEG